MSDPTRGQLAVTEEDVARHLGISRATVSRAMHGRGRISTTTRERVLAAANTLGYVPNTNAVRLASRHNDTLGLLLRDSENPAYAALLSRLQLEAQRLKYEIFTVTVSADEHGHNQLAGLRRLLGIRVAGLFVATGDVSGEQLHPFLKDVPMIRTGRPEPDAEIDAVSYNEPEHARILADHVFSLGHRDIGVIITDSEVSHPEWVRGTTAAARLRDAGASVTTYPARKSTDGIATALDDALTGNITALMLPTDTRLLDAMRAAAARGLRIPEDLSMTGCDGLFPGTDLLGLTTLRLPVEQLAEASMRRMSTLLASDHPHDEVGHELLAGTLIHGQTAAPMGRYSPAGTRYHE